MDINGQPQTDVGQVTHVTGHVVTPDHIRRIQDLLDAYDALRACFPDEEFHEAWDPIIEPLLWARPDERDPTLLAHVDSLAPSSPLWSMVRRFLDHQDSNGVGR